MRKGEEKGLVAAELHGTSQDNAARECRKLFHTYPRTSGARMTGVKYKSILYFLQTHGLFPSSNLYKTNEILRLFDPQALESRFRSNHLLTLV